MTSDERAVLNSALDLLADLGREIVARKESSASPDCSIAIPPRFAKFLREVLDEGWEYGDGEPMEDDARAAIAWIEAHGGM